MKLSGKTALITGGATGIGFGIAAAMADEGCRVAIAGRREEKLREAAQRYRGPTPLAIQPVDVADRASVTRLFHWAAGQLGPIDILVNAAGLNIVHRSLIDTTPEEWDRLGHDGLVINISSIAGKRALRLGGVAYCASKFAMTALGTFASLEEGRNGIRVTNIYPGEVDTPILENRPTPLTPEHRARILQPEDVAAAVVMIATLPARAHVAELVIKPTTQEYA